MYEEDEEDVSPPEVKRKETADIPKHVEPVNVAIPPLKNPPQIGKLNLGSIT